MYQEKYEGFLFSNDKELLDFDVIYQFISNSYWANGIPPEILKKSIDNSMCFAVYKDKAQIGFGRVITDFATFGYLGDVFIIDEYQNKGLGSAFISFIINYPEFKTLRRFLLATRTAHKFYENLGFSNLKNPQNFMDIHQPDIYKKKDRL